MQLLSIDYKGASCTAPHCVKALWKERRLYRRGFAYQGLPDPARVGNFKGAMRERLYNTKVTAELAMRSSHHIFKCQVKAD